MVPARTSLPAIAALTACTLLILGCERDSTRPTTNPTIEFLSGPGYTFQDDTVGMGDTLRVGVVINRGTDAMHHFKVTVSHDGGPVQTTDSLPMGTNRFEFEKTIVTRMQPGTERWAFNVVENDGDVIRRALNLTVR